MLAYARFAYEVKRHQLNATTQEFWRDYRYSSNPEHLKGELVFNVKRMVSKSMDYVGKGKYPDDVPAHLMDLYEGTQGEDGKVDDRLVLEDIWTKVEYTDMGPEDLQRIRRTVQNINVKQVAWHTYHWRYQRDQWALATVAELGLYALVFSRVRRFCGKK